MPFTTETYYDAEQKIWSGPKTSRKYGAKTTIGEVVLEVLKRNPQKVMQISDTTGDERTAGQLLRDSKLIAQYLLSLGLTAGDVVGICAKNTPNLTAIVLATLLCGTPYNPAFPGFDKENLKLVYKITMPKVFFCDVDNYETLKEATKELELDAKLITINVKLPDVDSVIDILQNELKNFDERSLPCFGLDGDSTAAILCSSGTTGGPKGITTSHCSFLERIYVYNFDSNDVILNFSTLFWASGTFAIFASLLNGATRIITEQPFTPDYFYHLVEKYRVTNITCGTEQLVSLIQNSKSDIGNKLVSVKTLAVGGAKVHETVARKFLELVNNEPKLMVAYGLTEFVGVSATPFGTIPRFNTEGKLMPNIEARIVDPISGEALGPNEWGLLHVSSPHKWAGYYRNEEATKKAYANGWLDTGDIAYFDNDGFLSLCAREKDIFKCNGFFIYPNKLESVILELPGVAEVCVFAKPDFNAVNLAACAIVRSNDEAGKKLTENIILEHVNGNVMEIHQIKGGVHFVDNLPKTASGKVQRKNVYEMIENGAKC